MCVLNICKINAYGKNYYLLVLWVWDFEYLLTTYLYHSAYTTFVITIFQWAYNEIGHFGFVPNWSHNFWHKILRTYNKASMAHTVQKVLLSNQNNSEMYMDGRPTEQQIFQLRSQNFLKNSDVVWFRIIVCDCEMSLFV